MRLVRRDCGPWMQSNQNGGIAVVHLSATRTWDANTMSKRPPYLEIALTAVVMAFLTLIVIGGIDTRNEGAGQISMRAD